MVMKYFYWAFCILLISVSSPAFSDVTTLTATVDKNPILLDESVSLQITALGGADRDDIDFSILSQNFRISQPSVSQSTQIINFDRTTTTTWTLQLFPRSTGRFIIPSFTIDGKSSEAIQVTVLPLSEAARTQPREFFVTAEVDNAEVYLQQQVRYTVKIHLAGEIQRGSLSTPVLDGAVIEQLGDDKEYQELVNGVRYRIIERNFAILPQASGAFMIDGPVFQAEVLTSTRQSFAYFNRSRSINRVAPAQTIIVLPIPENYQYTWLPSEQVQIAEEWQGDVEQMVQGEPITRTVTLTALGLIEEQLPNIEAQYHPDFKTYPEQPIKATVNQDNRLIAQLVQSTAIIPGQTGTFVLPEIRVPWFDVINKQTQFAVLPARSVRVVAPAQNTSTDNQEIGNNPVSSINDITEPDTNINSSNDYTGRFTPIAWGFDLLHLLLIAVVIILTSLLIWARKLGNTTGAVTKPYYKNKDVNNEAEAWNALNHSLESANISQVQQSLKVWLTQLSQSKVQSITNTLKVMGAEQVAVAFNSLLKEAYSSGHKTGDYAALKQALYDMRQREHAKQLSHTNTSMYPIQ
jgi:hypothetical protein